MYPCCQYNSFSLGHILLVLLWCDSQHITLVSCECLTQGLSLDKLLLHWVRHYCIQVLKELCISVWVAVGKEHVIIVVLEVVREGQGVKWLESFLSLLSDPILVVRNLRATPMPTNVFCQTILFRVDKYFHSIVVERIRFAKVQKIESNTLTPHCSRDPVEEPLSISTSIHIVLQGQVVVIVINL